MPWNSSAYSKKNVRMLFAALFLAFPCDASATGFRELVDNGVSMGIWYPSDTPTKRQRLGPFDVDIARDAPVLKGKHGVLLLSHGNSGFYRNHHLTAQVLADAGFVVVAPQHEADYLIGGRKTARALGHRYQELATTLKAVLNDAELKDHLNLETVHGFGYSVGAATMLLASGAEYSTERVRHYCRENGVADLEFCEDRGWIYRFLQSFRHDVTLPKTSDPFRNVPIVNGRLVLVAPVSQGLDLERPLSVSALTVFAIEGDRIAKPEFHARPIFDTVSRVTNTEYRTVQGHHFAFIAPFPKWLMDQEEIPVAKDPEGFDREAFLDELNVLILASFLRGRE